MPKPDWKAFRRLKHVTADSFKPYAQARAGSFNFSPFAKIEKNVFSQLQGWGRNKTTTVILKKIQLTKFHFEELSQAPIDGLYLEDCEFNDADAAALKGCVTLVDFFADDSAVGDKTCAALSTCTALKQINITDTQITDKGVRVLAKLPKLEILYLHGTQVTDKGIAAFAESSTLNYLGVSFTENVTDEGILKLAAVPKLEIGDAGCAITDDGIDAFLEVQRELRLAGRSNGLTKKTIKKSKKKKTTKSKDVAPAPSDVEAARAALFAFFEAINQWELNNELASRLAQKESVPESLEQDAVERSDKQLIGDIQKIFKQYCTPKKRTYGRPNGGFHSFPPTYHDYKEVDFYKVVAPSKRKLVFYTREWEMCRYQFIMVKKGENWLVDHKKHLVGKWENDYL